MTTLADELTDRPGAGAVNRMGIDERTPALKRTIGGSIDYDFYRRRAHRLRADAARGLFRQAGLALHNAFGRVGNRWTPGYRLLSGH